MWSNPIRCCSELILLLPSLLLRHKVLKFSCYSFSYPGGAVKSSRPNESLLLLSHRSWTTLRLLIQVVPWWNPNDKFLHNHLKWVFVGLENDVCHINSSQIQHLGIKYVYFFIDLLHHIFWRLHERLISRNLLRYLTISRGYETYIMCIVDCTLWGGKLQCRIGFLAHETRGQTTKTYGSSRYLLLIKKHLRTKYWAQHRESDWNSHCDEILHNAQTKWINLILSQENKF